MVTELFTNFSSVQSRAILLMVISRLRGGWMVTFKRAGRKRTLAQNNLYHGVYIPAFINHLRQQGQVVSHTLTHEMLKRKFLSVPVCDANGELIGEATRSTTELTTVEFNEFLNQIEAWMYHEFGITLPGIVQYSGESNQVTASRVMRPALPAGREA